MTKFTKKQQLVVNGLKNGLSVFEIANQMDIREASVLYHVNNIRKKMDEVSECSKEPVRNKNVDNYELIIKSLYAKNETMAKEIGDLRLKKLNMATRIASAGIKDRLIYLITGKLRGFNDA